MRSGADDSQQFAHITIIDFDDNSTGDADFNFDKWYFKYNVGNAEFRLGRDSLPFWRPDELTLDNDVTFAGLGFT